MEEPWIRTVQRLFYPVMSVFGMPASIVTIAVFWKGKLDLSKSIIFYLVALAVANFLLILVVTVFRDIFYFYVNISLWWPRPSCGVSNWIYFTCVYSLTWLTVAFTFDRYVIVCCSKLKLVYCTAKTTQRVILCVYTGAFLMAMPTFFIYVPVPTVGPNGTSKDICTIRKDLNKIPILSVYDHFQTTVWIVIPLVSLMLTNGLTVWNIVITTRVRQGLKSAVATKRQDDPEMARRRRSIMLLALITISFLGHWLPKMIIKVVERLTYPPVNRYNFYHPVNVVRMLANMLIVLSSFSNMCIYALTIEKFRKELIRGAKSVISAVCKPPQPPSLKNVEIFTT
ncbi:probable G-protein coupled receptor 139 [Pleurodeles waltl]|uniref:probable G-protein coupled receptor 139 n=1 Tax=Pleurodeles waltl TaxID=8319 RepID=UPI00370997F8